METGTNTDHKYPWLNNPRNCLGRKLEWLTNHILAHPDTSIDISDICVWGNGSDFDNKILSSLYADAGISSFWKYSGNRCAKI